MSARHSTSSNRTRSIGLVALFLLSMISYADLGAASLSRSYTTAKDPIDVAIGDFDCDSNNDLIVASDDTMVVTMLLNDGNGDFSERHDIWTSTNSSREAGFDDLNNNVYVDVGDFNGDSADDFVVYQRNAPFRSDPATGAIVPNRLGNITIFENDGCPTGGADPTFTVAARYTAPWVFDLEVADINGDGNDDIGTIQVRTDITNLDFVYYMGPLTGTTPRNLIQLGQSTQNTYFEFEFGDWGETQNIGLSSCEDLDIFLQRTPGIDFTTGTTTSPGDGNNFTVIEYTCSATGLGSYPGTFNFNPAGAQNNKIDAECDYTFDILDADGDGMIDTIGCRMFSGNVSYIESSTAPSGIGTGRTFSTGTRVASGAFGGFYLEMEDLNGDQEPDFIVTSLCDVQTSSSSTGGAASEGCYLGDETPTLVMVSNGQGGHHPPIPYPSLSRGAQIATGQLVGGASSAIDVVAGTYAYIGGGWDDEFNKVYSWDHITIIEMDTQDLAVTGIDIFPVDRRFGIVGEGTRDVNVTVTNTGMDSISGSATLTTTVQVVDTGNGTNETVYAHDWDSPEDRSGCGSGCTWSYHEAIDGDTFWHEETNHSTDPNQANGTNPTDFMWSGLMRANATGTMVSGYRANVDDSMTLENVDLTGADRAWMDIEIFGHYGWSGAFAQDSNGFYLVELWDHIGMIEVWSEDRGWSLAGCSFQAQVDGLCIDDSGTAAWGGYDNARVEKLIRNDNVESRYYYSPFIERSGTFYGWESFSEANGTAIDLSPWAGETVDIRFRFKSGIDGSVGGEEPWPERDGFAVDNITIMKQVTTFIGSPVTSSTVVPLTNLLPGEEVTDSVSIAFQNDTVYRVTSSVDYSGDQQDANDESSGYVTTLNLFDPAMLSINNFEAGRLYAEGGTPIEVDIAHYGNTPLDVDVTAEVFIAEPSDVLCGPRAPGETSQPICVEDFEDANLITTDLGRGVAGIYNDTDCSSPQVFGSKGYWFGTPCVENTGSDGYGEIENETLTISDIDLTGIQRPTPGNTTDDFVALEFEYFAETYFEIRPNGQIDEPRDYVAITLDWQFPGDTTQYEGLLVAQWTDFNEDGSCRVDSNGDGFTNDTEPFDNDEISSIGDPRNRNFDDGNWNVFFDTDGLVKSKSIDLTHVYISNRTGLFSVNECISLAGAVVDVNFEFASDDDGHNGENDAIRGIGFNDISLRSFTFEEDTAGYPNGVAHMATEIGVDGEEERTLTVGTHTFSGGVYLIEVSVGFDDTSVNDPWHAAEDTVTSNNIKRVIFNVESVNISLSRPNSLACLDLPVNPCLLPIDDDETHNWDIRAKNGVLGGTYVFTQTIHDVTDPMAPTEVYTQSVGPVTLDPQETHDIVFSPWDEYVNMSTYNITYSTTLHEDGSASGNTRTITAGFKDRIDVAILSDSTAGDRLDNILEDLDGLGMTYTQYRMADWPTYLTSDWMSNYDKIVLPWQTSLNAQDLISDENPGAAGGRGYYQTLAQHKQTLERFMADGGTLQMHMGPYQSYYQGDRLPLGMTLQDRTGTSQGTEPIDIDNTRFNDPYHPLMHNVSTAAFNGINPGSDLVADAILNINYADPSKIPAICGGIMEVGGSFQSIINTQIKAQEVLLATCAYQQGGLIITTLDVARFSDRWDSATMPLLGNMLAHHVTPYTQGMRGTAFNGIDMQIDGQVPGQDSETGQYETVYIKSNARVDFSVAFDDAMTRDAAVLDWEVDGPTGWTGEDISAPEHIRSDAPSMTFCDVDLGLSTGCRQNTGWNVTVYIHNDEGHTRVLRATLVTDDVRADSARPVANATVVDDDDDNELMRHPDQPVNVNNGAERWMVTIPDNAPDGVAVTFDATGSSDLDAITGNGISRYQWRVLFDEPHGSTTGAVNTYVDTDGLFTYNFRNITHIDNAGADIRIELTVYDKANKPSDRFRVYFWVVGEGYGDAEPVVTFDQINGTTVVEDWIYINGSIISGAENGVKVEVALTEDTLFASGSDKYIQRRDFQTWNTTVTPEDPDLADGEAFSLGLRIADLHSNVTVTQRVYVKVYEGNGDRWNTITWVEINLPICRGVEIPSEVGEGDWIMVDGQCAWDGAWTFTPPNTWTAPQTVDDGVQSGLSPTVLYGGIGAAVFLLLALLAFMFRRGGDDDFADKAYVDYTNQAFGAAPGYGAAPVQQLDPMEAYVQQLIAQGYPEETARAYAAHYATQFQQ